MRTYVCGFYFTDGQVLLIRKQRPEWQRGRLNGLGGKVEDGEAPIDAMAREFAEECGTLVAPERWEPFARLRGVDGSRAGTDPEPFEVYFFRADRQPADAVPTTVTDEVVDFYIDPPGPDALPNLSWLVPMAGESCRGDWPFDITEKGDSCSL